MKKILYTSIIVVFSIATSCEDYLDQVPQGLLTQEIVFDNSKTIKRWIANCYSYIPVNHISIGYPYGGSPVAQGGWNTMSDELDYTSNFGASYWTDAIQKGNWTSSSPTSTYCDYWTYFYTAIRQIHLFLNNVHTTNDFNEEEMNKAKLEVRFLRAYYYAYLIQVYGAVPLILDEISFTEDMNVLRTPYDEIVNWLDTELKDIAASLPLKADDKNWYYGQPTKGSALAVRARMLLYAARPLFNGNSDLKDVKNPDGTTLFNTTYSVEKWKRAADAIKDIFDLGVYDLHKEYNTDGSIDPYMSLINTFFDSDNEEIIFARTDGNNNFNWDSFCTPPCADFTDGNALGFLSITQETIDAFFTKDGLDIQEDPNYSETGFSTADLYATNTKWEDVSDYPGLLAPKGTYNMYIHREPRFYVDVMFNGQMCPQSKVIIDFQSWGGNWYHNQTGYTPRKQVDPTFSSFKSVLYRPVVLYRLAEFYLSYAEALNEYDPGNPNIIKHINLVRERAGIPGLSSSLDPTAMRKAILRERQIELFCESLRYFDITQWKMGTTLLNKEFHGMNISTTTNAATTTSFYARKVYETRVFKNYFNLWPIPFDEINTNKNLVQNMGW
ncbi:RagB/SusD family nutrient uptake outer membrane protein [uncultured Proteiniphilum sp.]|uniref:RagB/SusD family nutrient uptake outer membrane protein n=1 Tax=uncultured Proteiniphilum sp. TaxID=497637 RepID=UPI002635C0E2|nr:RagB/SusD family nutrient uptake outer membrane protein [uncultured Proteiniphilum sp.]